PLPPVGGGRFRGRVRRGQAHALQRVGLILPQVASSWVAPPRECGATHGNKELDHEYELVPRTLSPSFEAIPTPGPAGWLPEFLSASAGSDGRSDPAHRREPGPDLRQPGRGYHIHRQWLPPSQSGRNPARWQDRGGGGHLSPWLPAMARGALSARRH